MKKIIKNIEELDIFTFNFLSTLHKKDTATIITLSGDLGAGKTTFVKSVAKFFGIREEITSPTFVIQKEYEINTHNFLKKMIHIDAYRLENKSELEYLGWNDLILKPNHIIFIEWPEQVDGININTARIININILNDESREIEIT